MTEKKWVWLAILHFQIKVVYSDHLCVHTCVHEREGGRGREGGEGEGEGGGEREREREREREGERLTTIWFDFTTDLVAPTHVNNNHTDFDTLLYCTSFPTTNFLLGAALMERVLREKS